VFSLPLLTSILIGHALCALYATGAVPVYKATIVPRGNALGMVTQLPEDDTNSLTRQQMMARMVVAMGGRAAEEKIFGYDSVTSGRPAPCWLCCLALLPRCLDCSWLCCIGGVLSGVN
jgi:hypothetical protein